MYNIYFLLIWYQTKKYDKNNENIFLYFQLAALNIYRVQFEKYHNYKIFTTLLIIHLMKTHVSIFLNGTIIHKEVPSLIFNSFYMI